MFNITVMGTTNIDLEKLMKGEKDFHGCFSKDEIPSPLKKGGYIINMDNHEGNGTHWCGLYVFSPEVALWQDPFGILPPMSVVRSVQHFKEAYYSEFILEKLTGSDCGEISVQFLKEAGKGWVTVVKWLKKKALTDY